MSIKEQARELLAKDRQKAEQTQSNILERTEEELQEKKEKLVTEQARERLTETRQNLEQTQDNMLERAEEEIQP